MKRWFEGRVWLAAALLAAARGVAGAAETWRGLVVAPEHRCSPYERARDYPYPPSVKADVVRQLGAVVGPYTVTCFGSTHETDIKHIVATSEAHDSGLCARDRATRARFATDLRNLTLAGETLNRHQKSDKDAAEWLPARNRCWFAATVVAVRRACGLTIDRREAAALEGVLSQCDSVDMEPVVCAPVSDAGHVGDSGTDEDDVLARYDDNGNGRITCREARRNGIAPVRRGNPAYWYMRDGGGDGVVCE